MYSLHILLSFYLVRRLLNKFQALICYYMCYFSSWDDNVWQKSLQEGRVCSGSELKNSAAYCGEKQSDQECEVIVHNLSEAKM